MKRKAQSAEGIAPDAQRHAPCAMRKQFPLAHLPCALVLALVAMATPLPVAIGAGTPLSRLASLHAGKPASLPARADRREAMSVEECVEKCKACACRMSGAGWDCECLAPR